MSLHAVESDSVRRQRNDTANPAAEQSVCLVLCSSQSLHVRIFTSSEVKICTRNHQKPTRPGTPSRNQADTVCVV